MRLGLALMILMLVVPAAAQAADTPTAKTLYTDGPEGRYLMEGNWLFRLDPSDRGVKGRYYRRRSTAGWTTVTVPHAWNVGDHSVASMNGSVGWYRKDFELPSASAALDWAVRFESVNYRATVWLNGRKVGANAGAYLPFSVLLNRVSRRGTNRLVIRVDSRRGPTDLPPGRISPRTNLPTGGWWNYGGILREVYLQRIDTMQLESAIVNPRLGCATCDATVVMQARLRNVAGRARRATVTGTFGGRAVKLGTGTIRGGRTASFRGSFTLADPHLWSPRDPFLYPAAIEVRVGSRLVGRWTASSGVRSVKVSGGRLLLNDRALSLRGVGVHEDNQAQGFAVDNTWRRWLVDRAKELGASMLRTHYPMHPYIHELADREGLLIWSEIPVYGHKSSVHRRHHRAGAEAAAQEHRDQREPPVGADLVDRQRALVRSRERPRAPTSGGPSSSPTQLDPTRPVGLAVAGYPAAGCQRRYGPLDVVGVNDYFGWYTGPSGSLFDRNKLSAYLDSLRSCYPNDAIMVTEFGAEANRAGSVEDKGTYAFQQDFVNYQLGVFAEQAVAERRALLGAERVPRAPGVGRRQPVPDTADPPEGADPLRRHAQAGVRRRPALVHHHAPVLALGEPVRVGVDHGLRAVAHARPWRRCG